MTAQEEWNAALRQRYGAILSARFQGATAAVCGLGGLGSHIAVALARAGVGRMILADFDRVELSNLHRQNYDAGQIGQYKTEATRDNLCRIAPYLWVELHTLRLTSENLPRVLAGADVVLEAFDGAQDKAMLADGVLTQLPGVPLVAASGMAGLGSANTIYTRRVAKNFYLCGDGVSDVGDGLGLMSSRVMVCAAHQAHMALRLLAGETLP